MTIEYFYDFMNAKNPGNNKVTPFLYVHRIGNNEEWFVLHRNDNDIEKITVGIEDPELVIRDELIGDDFELFNINQVIKSCYIKLTSIPNDWIDDQTKEKDAPKVLITKIHDHICNNSDSLFSTFYPTSEMRKNNWHHLTIIYQDIELEIRTIENFAKYNNTRKYMDTGLKPICFLKGYSNETSVRINFVRDMSDGDYELGNKECLEALEELKKILKKTKCTFEVCNVRLNAPAYC